VASRVPADFVGRKDTVELLRQLMEAALADPKLVVRDPVLSVTIRRACDALGIGARVLGSRDSQTRSSVLSGRAPMGTIRVAVPVYFDAQITGELLKPPGVGRIAVVEVRPRPFDPKLSIVRWTGPDHRPLNVDHRSLESVSAVAITTVAKTLQSRPEDKSVGSLKRPRLAFDCAIHLDDIPVVGESAGLALAVAMLAAYTASVDRRRGKFPRADWAWTGEVTESGDINAVDPEALLCKVRAAFYSGCEGITVPSVQHALAQAAIAEAGSAFLVVGASTVREALLMDEAFEQSELPANSIRVPFHKRELNVRILAALILLLLGAAGACIESHKRGTTEGPEVTIEPSLEVATLHFEGGAPAKAYSDSLGRPFAFAAIVQNCAGGLDGRDQLLLVTKFRQNVPGGVELRDVPSLDLVWRYTFESDAFVDLRAGIASEGIYNGKTAVVADLNNDGDSEIVVSVSEHPYSTTLLVLFDDAPRPAALVYHPGHIEALRAVDWDRDGDLDILAAGYHAPTDGGSVIVLRREDFPERELTACTDFGRQPCVAHFVFPRVPHLSEAMSMLEMRAGDEGFTVTATADSTPGFRFDLGIPVAPVTDNVYLISVTSPRNLANVSANQTLVQSATTWLAEKRTSIDFTSQSLISEWTREFRVYPYIRTSPIDSADGGAPLVVP